MTSTDWLDEAFLEERPPESVDGGSTNLGLLWHAAPARWGHSMHTMCSYHGMFPAKLVHYFLEAYTDPGDLVIDPFCGRGTTVLQSRVEGRHAIAGDLNPLAFVLARAKARPPTWGTFDDYLTALEASFKRSRAAKESVPGEIEMLFNEKTLGQLGFLRRHLLSMEWADWSDEDFMLAGCVAGVLHGGSRADGTSAYLSISMPNTFSMSPTYVQRYIAEHKLTPPDANVFAIVRAKASRLYLDSTEGTDAEVQLVDANELLRRPDLQGAADLVITSPPYLRVVNYGAANWIRLWWLGLEDVSRNAGEGRQSLDSKLDHGHGYIDYERFIARVLDGVEGVLSPSGVAAIVIGDVASPEAPAIPLALTLWENLKLTCGLELVDLIEDDLPSQYKVSRIWGDTKGRATDRDCVLVLRRRSASKGVHRAVHDWSEQYKNAGPDAAHAAARASSRTTSDDAKVKPQS